MEENYAQLWQKLSAALKPQVSPDTFKRWFSAVKLVQATDDAFTFRVPNNIYQFWIESNHMAALQAAIVTAFGAPRKVTFSSASGGLDEESLPEIQGKESARENARDARQSSNALGLNPRNSFESFVIGPNNEIAHAASLAVAK
jgi:chromosomal replication initiator protein